MILNPNSKNDDRVLHKLGSTPGRKASLNRGGSTVADIVAELNTELQKYTYSGQGYSPKRGPQTNKRIIRFQD